MRLADVVRSAAEGLDLPPGAVVAQEGLDLLPAVSGDAGQLRQAFLNLLQNALQAAGPGGRVWVRGAQAPVCHNHVEAFITDPIALPLNHTIEPADFYETILGQERAVSVGFSRDAHGALVVTEAVTQTRELHRRNSAWGLTGVAAGLLRLYPALRGVQVVRSWAIPTPFSPDEQPLVGWVPGRDNLFVAAGFMETITAVPLISEWMARMILGETLPVDLGAFAPDRFQALRGGMAYE